MEFDTTILGREVGPVSDSQDGFGDIVITPLIGWHSGNWNYSGSLSIYAPTGEYSDAVIRPRQGEYDVLSIGKNKWAFDPTFAVTWLDPTIGLEVDGALGITFSTINEATDYQTAPELHFEGAIGQHFKNGATLGLAGYIYQQLADDSGSGRGEFQEGDRREKPSGPRLRDRPGARLQHEGRRCRRDLPSQLLSRVRRQAPAGERRLLADGRGIVLTRTFSPAVPLSASGVAATH